MKRKRICVLPASAESTSQPPLMIEDKLPLRSSLKQLRDVVWPHLGEGVTIEFVTLRLAGVMFTMIIDEDGIGKDLPVNVVATRMYRESLMQAGHKAETLTHTVIVGTAILFDRHLG